MLFFLLSCSPKTKPVNYLDIRHDYLASPPPECSPSSDFFIARGIAGSERRAKSDARQSIAKSFKSEIQGSRTWNQLTVDESSSTNETNTSYYKKVNRMKGKIKSSFKFKHNGYIKEVIPPTEMDGQYRTLYCLSKVELGNVLRSEIEDTVDRYDQSYNIAMYHSEKNDCEGFVPAYAKSATIYNEAEDDLYEYALLHGGSSIQLFKDWRGKQSKLRSAASTCSKDLNIAFHYTKPTTNGATEENMHVVLSGIQEHLRSKNIMVTNSEDCRNTSSHQILLSPTGTCKYNSLKGGEACLFDLSMEVRNCVNGNQYNIPLSASCKGHGQSDAYRDQCVANFSKSDSFRKKIDHALLQVFPLPMD